MRLKSPATKKVRIKEWPVTFGSHGLKLAGKIFLPEDASAESPIPGAVLCHGFGSSHRAVKNSAKIMAEQGIATLIFDFRGHGSSEGALDGRQAEDAIDAWNTLKQFPEVDKSRIGLIGHSLGAMSAIIAAGEVDSPKMIVALACPPIIDEKMLADATANFGHWGREENRIVEFPKHGSFPFLTGISAVIARLWMFLCRYYARIDVKKFTEGILRLNMTEALNKLDNCAKLFVFCEDDIITPYTKSVLVYEAACEPKVKFLARGNHSTSIGRGNLRSQWTTWAVDTLHDRRDSY